MITHLRRWAVLAVAALCLQPAGAASTAPATFATPNDAAKALVDAAAAYNVPRLLQIFGPNAKELFESADPVRDKQNAAEFVKKAREKLTIRDDSATQATIVVGDDAWPLPVPIVKANGRWSFDSTDGEREVLLRRIGANELDAIQVCRGYVAAQRTYSLQRHNGVNQYAQRIFSTPGKHDGLYWQNEDGTHGGPIAKPVANALSEGYSVGKGGFHGYYYKILTGQGPDAPLGKMNYVIEGVMIGGFGLVAVPAEYRVTGVKTFIVSNSGIVYEKDLGPNSLSIAKEMSLYNPDSTWQPTNAAWPGNTV